MPGNHGKGILRFSLSGYRLPLTFKPYRALHRAMATRASLTVKAKCVLFTWSQVGDEQTAHSFKADVVDRIYDIFDDAITALTAGVEQHSDGGFHVHACLYRKQSKLVKLGTRLDMHGRTVQLSPIKKHAKADYAAQLRYPLKEDETPFSSFDDEDALDLLLDLEFPARTGPGASRDEAFAQALEADSYEGAMLAIRQGAPSDYVLRHADCARFFKDAFTPAFEKKYDIGCFNLPAVDWDSLNVRQSFVLLGGTNLGKTAYALACFERPLFVRHIEVLKQFNPAIHDGLVLDEMSFTKWPPASVNQIYDRELPVSVHVRWGRVDLPAGVKRIFCFNDESQMYPENCPDAIKEAIDSRLEIKFVHSRLF